MPCPLPRRTRRVRVSVASPSARPSPFLRRVGVRDFTFEASSGFTRVTACRIAPSPKATFVTRLRPGGLPRRAARQLPAQPTTRWVEPSSTGKPRRRGALNFQVSSHHTITDAEGLEVADVDEARSFAREAAAEMSQDGVAEIAHWRGWEVEARDASGTVLFTVGFEALLPAETQETEASTTEDGAYAYDKAA